jgi:F-type H+-transporting ATPase subunit epsilon
MPLRLSVVTPERPVIDGEVDSVQAPGAEGEFGVLPGHEPFLAPLAGGDLRYTDGSGSHRIGIAGGFAEVTGERVTILADSVVEDGSPTE